MSHSTIRVFLISFFFLFVCGSVDLTAQDVIPQNSVYSFFGLGDLHPNALASGRSVGYTVQAHRDPLYINYGNPASYSSNALSKFTSYETAIDFNGYQIGNGDLSSRTSHAQLSYLALAFPVYKAWGSSIGFLPYSRTTYNVREVRETEGIGNEILRYVGEGGFNQIYWGNAYAYKGLSIGLNLNYVFGTTNKTVVNFYESVPNGFDLSRTLNTTAKGWTYKAGIQYERRLGNVFLTLGASGHTNSKLSTTGDLTWSHLDRTINVDGSSFTIRDYGDTLYVQSLENSNITLPATYGFGIALSDSLKRKYTITAEVELTNWESYQQDFEDLSVYQNAYKFALGVRLMPNSENSRNVFRRSRYNFGGYYTNGHLNLNGIQVPAFGFTTGLEMPLNPPGSARLNLAFDFGQRGSIENQYVLENYAKVTLGFSFNNVWFVKRRYD